MCSKVPRTAAEFAVCCLADLSVGVRHSLSTASWKHWALKQAYEAHGLDFCLVDDENEGISLL